MQTIRASSEYGALNNYEHYSEGSLFCLKQLTTPNPILIVHAPTLAGRQTDRQTDRQTGNQANDRKENWRYEDSLRPRGLGAAYRRG